MPNGARNLDSNYDMHPRLHLPSTENIMLGAHASVLFASGKTLRAASWYGMIKRVDQIGRPMPIIRGIKTESEVERRPEQVHTSQEQASTPPNRTAPNRTTEAQDPVTESNVTLASALVASSKKSQTLKNLVLAIDHYLEEPTSRLDLYAKSIEEYITGPDFGRDGATKGFDDYIMDEYQRLQDQRVMLAQLNQPHADTTTDSPSIEKSVDHLQNALNLTHITLHKENLCSDDLDTLDRVYGVYWTNKFPRMDEVGNTKELEKHFHNSRNLILRKIRHNARDARVWPPRLPWFLPSPLSLYRAGPCLICYNR